MLHRHCGTAPRALTAAFLAHLSLATPALHAADETTVLVTATRTPTRVSALISDVTVIDRVEIEQKASSSLAEILQAQPGVQILSAAGGPGAATAISIRGATAQQALVLVDGQRLSSATVGSTALEHIPASQIERIEILRGPASALYGADAIAGVVQIFTRRGSGAPRFSGEAGVGAYHTAMASAGYGGKANDTSFQLRAGASRSGSFSATRPGAFGFSPDRDPYRNANVSAQLAHRFQTGHELGARLFHSRAKTRFDAANCDPAFVVCTNDFDNYQTQELGSYALYGKARFTDAWQSELRWGESRDDLTSHFLDPVAGAVAGQRFRTIQDQLVWQNDISHRLGGGRGKLMLAAERLEEKVDANTVAFTVSRRRTDSLIAGWQAWVGPHIMQLSARHDDNSQFGGRANGAAGYGYQISPAWRASASIATAHRAPTFADLYWPVDFASFYVGNPDLKPERSLNRELALRFDKGAHSGSLTAYHNRVRDLIAFAPAAAPAFFITTVNFGRAVLKGATASYQGRFGNWRIVGSYDILSARDEESGRFLIRRAARSGSLETRYEAGRWKAGVALVGSGPRWQDTANTRRSGGFVLVNADAEMTLAPAWSIFARASNILDKDYTLVQGFATAGASLFVGIRYEEAPR